ncbi:MAG: Co2+/Mg2+ efflux protein ApaG [Planctomycetota bacterium]
MHDNSTANNPPHPDADGRLGSAVETGGIRVSVQPRFVPEHSDPESGRFAFSYQVKIENVGSRTARLVRRHWEIVDAEGDRKVVDDEGVVGEQPLLGPCDAFEYASWCPLETRWGTMEGFYTLERDDGSTFDASIGRFYLVAGDVPTDDAVSV